MANIDEVSTVEEMNNEQYYFFTDSALMKIWTNKNSGREYISHSGVALNWLLDDRCEIRKVDAA